MNDKYSIFTLSNGLKVLLLPLGFSKFTYVSLVGKAGHRSETNQEVGAAHFLEHLFFDGTKSKPNSYELIKFVDDAGGKFNGVTEPECVEYFVKIHYENVQIAFQHLSDIFLNSLLQEIDKEKKVIRQEALSHQDDPVLTLSHFRRNTIYPNQPLGRSIITDQENINTINQPLIINYKNKCYNANNFILCIAGKFDTDEVKSLSDKYFSSFPSGQEQNFAQAVLSPNKTINIHHMDVTQAKLSISFKAFPIFTDETNHLSLLSTIISGSQSSRLYWLLRHQNHLVYSVGCNQSAFSDTGYVSLTPFLDEVNVPQAIDIILKELNKLKLEGVSVKELQKAQNIAISNVYASQENLESYTRYYSRQFLFHRPIVDFDNLLEKIKQTTQDDLSKIIQIVFSDQPKVTLISKTLDDIAI